MEKNLSYFMREEKEEIVTVPAPESFVDNKGKRLELQVKTISRDRIRQINESYRRREVAVDKNGKPYTADGEVLFKTENDTSKALRHIIAEALVFPDLTSQELMDFYKCYDKTEMPLKVFSKPGEYSYVADVVLKAIGLIEKDDSDLDEAKN